jgi:hypothetical protein
MPIVLCMTKTDTMGPYLNELRKKYKPKRFDADDEVLEPGVDREMHMIRSR